ncbi:ATP-binding protein [Pyrococcus kukulkanii]|uniref:Type IV secretion system DNA-binding domain-containing protein n=1 Tax=Pyrococcus kukulkanii TaxID=1609559 RepID=A0ABV4T5T0_9EURY
MNKGTVSIMRIYPRAKGEKSLGRAIQGADKFIFVATKVQEETHYYLITRKTENLLVNFEVMDVEGKELPDLSKYKYKATLWLPKSKLADPLKIYQFENNFAFLERDMVIVVRGYIDPKINSLIKKRIMHLKGKKTIGEELLDILTAMALELFRLIVPTSGEEKTKEKKKEVNVEEIKTLEKRFLQPVYRVYIEIYHNNKKELKAFAERVRDSLFPRPNITVGKNRTTSVLEEKMHGYYISVSDEELDQLLVLPTISSALARGAYLPAILEEIDTENEIVLGTKPNGQPLTITLDEVKRHVYILGQTGSGKSNTLHVLVSEMRKKWGDKVAIWVIDPHGALARDIVLELGDENTYYFHPLKTGFKINPLEIPEGWDREKAIAHMISELMGIFEKIMELDMNKAPNVAMLLMLGVRYLYTHKDNPTLPELLEFYLDLRTGAIDSEKIEDPTLRKLIELTKEMPAQSFISTVSRLLYFSITEDIRKMFDGNTIPFEDLIKPGKLVVWSIPRADLPEKVQALLMAVIVMKLWFVIRYRYSKTMEELGIEEEDVSKYVTPVILVVDEFQNLQELGLLDVVLTEARKFGLHMVMAHQNLKQLDDKLLEAVLGNTSVQIIMRTSGVDAQRLAPHLDPQFQEELIAILPTLDVGQAVVKKRVKGVNAAMPQLVKIPLAPPPKHPPEWLEKKIAEMREKFGAKDIVKLLARDDIERILNVNFVEMSEDEIMLHAIAWAVWKNMEDPFEENIEKDNTTLAQIAKTLGKNRLKIERLVMKHSTGATPLFALHHMPTGGRPMKRVYVTRQGFLKLVGDLRSVAPSDEGYEVIKKAFTYYVKNSNKPLIIKTTPKAREGPDLLIAPIDLSDRPYKIITTEAIAVEVESTVHIQASPEQVKKHALKSTARSVKEVHYWTLKENVEKIKEILKDIPEDRKHKIKIIAVSEEGIEEMPLSTNPL